MISGIINSQGTLVELVQARPTKEELIEQGILKSDGVSSVLQSAQEALKHQLIEDELQRGLASRPEKENLIAQGILKSGAICFNYRYFVSPALLESLKNQMTEDAVNRKLTNRPQKHELFEQNILKVDLVAGSLQAAQIDVIGM
jgi:RPEL repeat